MWKLLMSGLMSVLVCLYRRRYEAARVNTCRPKRISRTARPGERSRSPTRRYLERAACAFPIVVISHDARCSHSNYSDYAMRSTATLHPLPIAAVERGHFAESGAARRKRGAAFPMRVTWPVPSGGV